MTTEHGSEPALETALAYHRAWTSGKLELAMSHVAPNIVCQAPSGRLEGAAAFREFMGPFVQMLISSSLVAAFGDDRTAVLFYDTNTKLVNSAPGAECLTVTAGKISHMRIIFDRLPFEVARREAVSG